MESLAMLVVVLVLVMLVSSAAALVIGWRARSARARIVALLVGAPGMLLGTLFVTSVGSTGAMLFGACGMTGFLAAAYRSWRAPQALQQD